MFREETAFARLPETLLRLQGPGSKAESASNTWWQLHAQGFHRLNPRGQQLCAFPSSLSSSRSPGSLQESTAGIYNDEDCHLKPKRVVPGLAGKHYTEFSWEIHFFLIQPRSRSNENFTNHSWGYWINASLVFWRQLWIVNKDKYQAPVPSILQLERGITCKIGGGGISILLPKWNEKVENVISASYNSWNRERIKVTSLILSLHS